MTTPYYHNQIFVWLFLTAAVGVVENIISRGLLIRFRADALKLTN